MSRFADAIAQLREMGFEDARQCEAALEATKGSLDDAIVLLMQ